LIKIEVNGSTLLANADVQSKNRGNSFWWNAQLNPGKETAEKKD
jgi:hypothetical protein